MSESIANVDDSEIEEVTERLGRCLYERLEDFDPGGGEFVEWEKLGELDRELYRSAIEGVFVGELASTIELAGLLSRPR